MQTIDAQADELLTDLHVVSMIPENGRLCIRNGNLSVEMHAPNNGLGTIPAHIYIALKRWWFHDNRASALTHVQNTIVKSFALVKELNSQDHPWLLGQFKESFINAQTGLEHMKMTYTDDANTRARIEVLLERLTDAIYKLD